MANFRPERLLIRVAGPLDFDPNEGIDAERFASIMFHDDAAWDRPALEDYTFSAGDTPMWFPAFEGLNTVRAVIDEMRIQLRSVEGVQLAELEGNIQLLLAVEGNLNRIDAKDHEFSLAALDLE